MKLAAYLFGRLRQLGVGSIHGVPGDYNLDLLDYVEPAGLTWVGNTNELNAAYAADGYARIKGIGALITTFGVGELSAINAIAGAYAERAAVVHIVGIPSRAVQNSRLLAHHTFNDGNYQRFSQMHAYITVAQTRLWDIRTCAQQIDDVLQQCLLHSRPVYIEIPVDLVPALVPEERSHFAIETPEAPFDSTSDDIVSRIICNIYLAKQPVIFVDGESRALGVLNDVQRLSATTNWPTWTTPFGKGLMDETLPNFHGIHRGDYDDHAVQAFLDHVDLILCFGPHFSSSNTYGYSSIPNKDATISFTDTTIRIGSEVFENVPVKSIVSRLATTLDISKVKRYEPYPILPRDKLLSILDVPGDQPIAQNQLWRVLANILRPGDIVLGETGTAGYGVREMKLPRHARVFTPVTWLSIGYMLPAAQGAALAQRELTQSSTYFGIQDARTILFIGDGSFQMTVQELGTIIKHELDVLVFLVNNDGYTIERCIHGRTQGYNDIARWRYLQAPSFFGAGPDTYTGVAKSWAELRKILEDDRINNGKGLRMVELLLDREDAPNGPLLHYLERQKAISIPDS